MRAKVLYLNADSITLRFIDSGLRKTVGKNTALMVMSEELREYPQQAVKMYMADLIPIDFDEMFDGQSSKRLQTLLNKPKEKTQQWRANVRIPFKSALIVDNVRLVSWIAGVERFVDTGTTAARELFNNGLAIEDKNQLSVLTEMCTKAGFNLPSAPRMFFDFHGFEIYWFSFRKICVVCKTKMGSFGYRRRRVLSRC